MRSKQSVDMEIPDSLFEDVCSKMDAHSVGADLLADADDQGQRVVDVEDWAFIVCVED